MVSRLLSFPNPVNDVAARTVAGGVLVMAVVAITTQQLWVIAILAYGFVARVLSGPRFSPLGRAATTLVAPRLGRYAKSVPGPPKRFAQGMGAVVTCTALGLWLSGHHFASSVLLACLTVPAFLESGMGFCVGCEIFSILMRFGIIPTSICEECADIYSETAIRRREARAQKR